MHDNFSEVEDFILDDSFIAWVYKTNPAHIARWDAWLAANPQKADVAMKAAGIVRQIQITEKPLGAGQATAARTRLLQAMEASGDNRSRPALFKMRKIWYAAASVILIVAFAAGLKFIVSAGKKPLLASSDYGQVKQDKLPDGSEIILNANSSLTGAKTWKEGDDREVWIKGEAFFHVKKTARLNKFIVHTDAFDIEVTGTSFNVINRDGKSSVTLKEGSVNIHRAGEPVIVMKPGDVVEFANRQLNKKTVSGTEYIAWTENKLVFENVPLKEAARMISTHYGVEVRLEGDDLKDKTITGIMPNNNLDVLLQSLEATQEFSIRRTQDVITISNNN